MNLPLIEPGQLWQSPGGVLYFVLGATDSRRISFVCHAISLLEYQGSFGSEAWRANVLHSSFGHMELLSSGR